MARRLRSRLRKSSTWEDHSLTGLAAAVGLTRIMSSLLFEIKPTGGVTFVSVVMILTAIAVLACLLPARRAAKVDPMEALRCE
jgi:putative ABC transport system permease protein